MEPFIGEIKIFGGNFAPRGWAFCQGQLLAIAQNQALFSLLGTTYGGDGRTTFGLPDLRGRAPIGFGTGPGLSARVLGARSGQERVTLSPQEMPAHSHVITNQSSTNTGSLSVVGSATIKCSSAAGDTQDPNNGFPAETKTAAGDKIYCSDATKATSTMNPNAVELNASVQGEVQVTVVSDCHSTGGSIGHDNMQPWIGVNYIIALVGIYPSRS